MTVTVQHDPRLDLVLERVVDVAPDLVCAAWTKPEQHDRAEDAAGAKVDFALDRFPWRRRDHFLT